MGGILGFNICRLIEHVKHDEYNFIFYVEIVIIVLYSVFVFLNY